MNNYIVYCLIVNVKNKKGAKDAGFGLCVWIPLNFPAPVEMNEDSVIPDITLSNIYELKSLVIVDDEKPKSLLSQQSSGIKRSLTKKASILSTCPDDGCFPANKRALSQPEIENSNSNASNASDGF